MDKRQFLKTSSAATVLAAFGLTLESCSEDDDASPGTGSAGVTVDLTESTFSALNTDGGWVLHPSQNILLVNVGGTISAFTSVCTHSGCSRDWAFATNAFCTCHNSEFDTNGQVVSGPATRALAKKSVTQDGDVLTIS